MRAAVQYIDRPNKTLSRSVQLLNIETPTALSGLLNRLMLLPQYNNKDRNSHGLTKLLEITDVPNGNIWLLCNVMVCSLCVSWHGFEFHISG